VCLLCYLQEAQIIRCSKLKSGVIYSAIRFHFYSETIRNIRLSRLESKVLNQWDKFTIWNAGKSGRRLYRALSQSNKDKVQAFCDIDEKKLRQKTYHPYPLKCKIPILHPRDAKPPFIICVKAVSLASSD
jgi:hypothetical protein